MGNTADQSVVLITGASSAIGTAIAVRLSRRYRLILAGRTTASLEGANSACVSPSSHERWVADLADIESLQGSLQAFLTERRLRVVGFVHCAGVSPISAARATNYAMLKKVADVNFASAALITATLMKKQLNDDSLSRVVLVSSILSKFGAKGQSLYCATKAALNGLTRALAVELAPRVRVNSILPGAVPSAMASAALSKDSVMSVLQRSYPLGVGAPDRVAGMVDFLFSEDANWITGQELIVDGGRSINHPFE